MPRRAIAKTFLAAFLLLPLVAPLRAESPAIEYAPTRRVDHVDDYHGTKVADPYRWLEDDVRQSKAVEAWVAAENEMTFAYLQTIPQRPAIRRRLTELWNFARYSAFSQTAGRYFFFKNDGLQNQDVLYTSDAVEGEGRVLLDPNQWSADGTIALAGTTVSDDAQFLAYGVAGAGSDWKTLRVLEIETGKILDDEIQWTKSGHVAWTKDAAGFFYSRYDKPPPGEEFQGLNLNQKLYYHRLGTPQSQDELVYHRADQPRWGYSPTVTEDGRYLVITVWKGTDAKYRVLVKDLADTDGKPLELVDHFQHEFSFVGNDGPVFYFKTDLDAPRKRIIATDLRTPEPEHYREIVGQMAEPIRSVSLVGDLLFATYLKDAKTEVKLYKTSGAPVREVKLPGIGTVYGFHGRRTDTETFYSFSSFATPPSIYRYDLNSGESRLIRRPEVKFDPDAFKVKQVFYRSKDGTRVPMFVVHRQGLELDGSNPTLLDGYGGFNASLTPRFSVSRLAWLEMGGVAAIANLRGGGEYGEDWHRAGTRLQKQNVFDDFIAAAEWLIEHRYTRPDRLAIQGGSNGGLLVGAVMTQRPDLFGAALPAVGVMDMLRFHKFTSGRFWVDDYGSSDNREEFAALLAYSPYHNLKEGTAYPATLVTTADTDDRVVPAHSFKFISRLQHCQAGSAPVLIRIETRAGHGAGKPTTKRIEEIADQWAFLVKNLGMKLPANAPTNPSR